jgi:hypothetical protein
MKRQISKGAAIAIIVVVVALLGWFGMRAMETPENRGLDEEKTFRDAERTAKSNGVDIKTIPQWTGLYYKYHPEEKPPSAAPAATPKTELPPGAATAPSNANPGAPPTMH